MKKLSKYTEIIKHLERQGWKRKNILNPETVASHSWHMAILALYLSKDYEKEYDFNKVINLCLCHDLAESIIGDITPNDSFYKNKKEIEKEAMKKIKEECHFDKVYDLFIEYEEKITNEAKLANDLDQIDVYIQSLDYENKYKDLDLSEFRISALNKLQTSLGKKIIDSL